MWYNISMSESFSGYLPDPDAQPPKDVDTSSPGEYVDAAGLIRDHDATRVVATTRGPIDITGRPMARPVAEDAANTVAPLLDFTIPEGDDWPEETETDRNT